MLPQTERLEVIVRREGERTLLCAPEVGWFTRALPRNTPVGHGTAVGVIATLGRTRELVLPSGVSGRIVSRRPERVHEPVGWGTTLYELEPLEPTEGAEAAGTDAAAAADGAVFRAPYSGRFWHRPAPKDPAFVKEGDILEPGRTVGLIEVMKTFTHLSYEARGELPSKARILKLLAGDGDEVSEGDPLIEIENV